jgi:hypothetical protein
VRQDARVIASYLGTDEAAINRSGGGRPAASAGPTVPDKPAAKPKARTRAPRKAAARVTP